MERLEDRTLLAAPHPFDLSTLDGSNGFRLDGIDVDDYSGYSVSTAGDVNGDGYADILVGAYGADDPGGHNFDGETYVVFGSGSGFAAGCEVVQSGRVEDRGPAPGAFPCGNTGGCRAGRCRIRCK